MPKQRELQVLGTIEMKRAVVEMAKELHTWYDNMPGWFRVRSDSFHEDVAARLEGFLPDTFEKAVATDDPGTEWIFSEYKFTPMMDGDKVQILVQDAATTAEALLDVTVID